MNEPDEYCPVYLKRDIPEIKVRVSKAKKDLVHSAYLCTLILRQTENARNGTRCQSSTQRPYLQKREIHRAVPLLNMSKFYGGPDLELLLDFFKIPRTKESVPLTFPAALTETLILKGFLEACGGKEENLLSGIRKTIGGINIKNLVLLASNNCNFRCSYCQIEENIDRRRMVTCRGSRAKSAGPV